MRPVKHLKVCLIYAAFVSFLMLLNSPIGATTCADAIPITTFPIIGQSIVCGTTNDLSQSTVPGGCTNLASDYKGGKEALYTFTPTSSGTYFVNYYGKVLTAIFVYQGCPTAGGTCIKAVGSTPAYKSLSANLTAGVTYYIWFDVWTGSNGPCAATFSLTSSVANDDCAGAIPSLHII